MKEKIKCYCGHTTTCDCGPETLEEAAENFWLNDDSMTDNDRISYVNGFVQGAKWQMERSYSEEEVLEILKLRLKWFGILPDEFEDNKWFENLKKKTKI